MRHDLHPREGDLPTTRDQLEFRRGQLDATQRRASQLQAEIAQLQAVLVREGQPTDFQILNTPMGQNDAGAATIGGYLVRLLGRLWEQQEHFNSKRPFGSGSWESLYAALGQAGFIRYREDSDGGCSDVDTQAGDRLIASAIRSLGLAGATT